jgi:hypothetical protein
MSSAMVIFQFARCLRQGNFPPCLAAPATAFRARGLAVASGLDVDNQSFFSIYGQKLSAAVDE